MDAQIERIKAWLGTGSINIFGLPMSGKDTVGVQLAEKLGGKFLSSGMIARAMEKSSNQDFTSGGKLMPSNIFYEWVLPYFEKPEIADYSLVLSSIGRWFGEEDQVMHVAKASGHPIRAAVMLQLTEQDVAERWEAAKMLDDRGLRSDDIDPQIFQMRIKEYKEKTIPVLRHYQELGLLVPVKATASREQVLANTIEALAKFSAQPHDLVAKL